MRATRSILLAALLLGLSVAAVRPARADDVSLDTRSGASSRLPVRCLALAPAGDRDAGKTSVQADEVLAADLQNSSVFAVARAWDPRPGAADPSAEIGGHWTVSGSQVRLAGEVHALPGNKPIFVQEYRGPLAQWRSLVHRFADDVVMQFTGEPGIATTRIAFVTDEGRNKELWVMDADGANAQALTHDASIAQEPSWAPDGSLLLFTSYRGRSGPQLWVLAPETRRPFLVSGRPGINTSGSYSPDGRSIACTLTQDGNAEIYRLDARGGAPQRLTNHRSIDASPCWAPTGREIAFTSDRSGTPQVLVMNADGGNVHPLTWDAGYMDSPAWSPKGDRIAYVVRTDRGFDIWTRHPDGTTPTRIVSGGDNENPSWSPDGRHIVFTSDRDGRRALWVSDLDGGAPRKLDAGGHVALSPAWSPRGGPVTPH